MYMNLYIFIYFFKASKELCYNLDGKAKWYSHFGKIFHLRKC